MLTQINFFVIIDTQTVRNNYICRVGNTHGSGNKGKPKSEEHKKNIAEAIKRKYNKQQINCPGGEMVYSEDLKSSAVMACGFESRPGHQIPAPIAQLVRAEVS